MNDKCFCHLNGYRVKDAEARNRITTLEEKIENIKSIEYSMPLGLIAYGRNNLYTNDLPHECDEELLKIVDDIMGSHEGAIEGVLYPTNITIVSTTESVTVDGVTVENPSPRHLIFDRVAIHYKGEGENDPTLDSITLYGSDPVGEGTFVDGHFDKGSAMLLIQFVKSSETGEYTLTGVPGKLIIGKLEVATTKYVNDAIANIEIPEGEGSNYPIYYTYIALDFGTARKEVTYSADHNSGICEKLANILTDMVAKGYQVAEIINYAYSMNHKFTFKKPLRSSNSTAYLISTEYDYSNDIVSYATINVSYTVTDGVYTVSQVVVTPYSKNYATRDYVTTAITQAGGASEVVELHLPTLYCNSQGTITTQAITGNTSDNAKAVIEAMKKFGSPNKDKKLIHLSCGYDNTHCLLSLVYIKPASSGNTEFTFRGYTTATTIEGVEIGLQQVDLVVTGYYNSSTGYAHTRATLNLKLLGDAILFDNPEGTSENITLSQAITNFNYLEIYYSYSNCISSVKVLAKESITILQNTQLAESDNIGYESVVTQGLAITNNQLTFHTGHMFQANSNGEHTIASTSFKINRVVGIR